jgi:hypothetical protein
MNNVSEPVIFCILVRCTKKVANEATFFDLFKESGKYRFEIGRSVQGRRVISKDYLLLIIDHSVIGGACGFYHESLYLLHRFLHPI